MPDPRSPETLLQALRPASMLTDQQHQRLAALDAVQALSLRKGFGGAQSHDVGTLLVLAQWVMEGERADDQAEADDEPPDENQLRQDVAIYRIWNLLQQALKTGGTVDIHDLEATMRGVLIPAPPPLSDDLAELADDSEWPYDEPPGPLQQQANTLAAVWGLLEAHERAHTLVDTTDLRIALTPPEA